MTTEKQVDLFLKRSEMELRNITQAINNVGNRPHYPMMVLWNDPFAGEEFDKFGEVSTRIKRIWPQSFRYMVNFCYRIEADGTVSYQTIEDSRAAEIAEVRDAVSAAQGAWNHFTEMGSWWIYHVVDTSRFQSAKEFLTHCNALQNFHEVLNENASSMLLLLLDDSPNAHGVSQEIRELLVRKRDQYDSVVIVSNRTRDGKLAKKAELYRIAIGVLILSNNDSVNADDSASFRCRVSQFSNGKLFVVSYQSMERPNRDIALQIHQNLLDAALLRVSAPVPEDSSWNGFLTDAAGTHCNSLCEQAVKRCPIEIDPAVFEHLPLRSVPKESPRHPLCDWPYERLKQFTFERLLPRLVEEYGAGDEAEHTAEHLAEEMAERWKARFLESDCLPRFRELTDRRIARMVEELELVPPRESQSARDYLKECVQMRIREKILYPRLQRAVRELHDLAVSTQKAFENLQSEYRELTPLGGFAHLGTDYESAVRNFIKDPAGEKHLSRICSAGDVQSILEHMLECFCELVERNRDLFSLPFIDEWTRRLRQEEGRKESGNLYGRISKTLTGEEDNLFRLRGNYPVEKKRLRVFFLHTADMSGQHFTDLYQNLRVAFAHDGLLQYLNTGYTGELEAFTLLECDRDDLML